jgi:hypothetical protein
MWSACLKVNMDTIQLWQHFCMFGSSKPMDRYLLTIFVLVIVAACQLDPKPLVVWQLHFPYQERDNGIASW